MGKIIILKLSTIEEVTSHILEWHSGYTSWEQNKKQNTNEFIKWVQNEANKSILRNARCYAKNKKVDRKHRLLIFSGVKIEVYSCLIHIRNPYNMWIFWTKVIN